MSAPGEEDRTILFSVTIRPKPGRHWVHSAQLLGGVGVGTGDGEQDSVETIEDGYLAELLYGFISGENDPADSMWEVAEIRPV